MPPLLELTDIDRADLPLYEQELLPTPLPGWVREAAIAHALGQVPIVRPPDVALTPGRYVIAAAVEGLHLSWRDDGDGAWTLCALVRQPSSRSKSSSK